MEVSLNLARDVNRDNRRVIANSPLLLVSGHIRKHMSERFLLVSEVLV